VRPGAHLVKLLLLFLLTTHHGMDHCGMPSSDSHEAIQTCSTVQTHCSADLFLRASEQLTVPTLHPESLAESAPAAASASRWTTGNNQRSTPGFAPLITPLRI
jgi:hypothetical protein